MIALRLREIADITGGVIHPLDTPDVGDVLVDGAVVTDSREAVPGSLYVARVGEKLDGHLFVDAARRAGAVAALVTTVVDDQPCVLVADIQEAFAALARGVIDRSPSLTVIGITGSSGKTSTKDLLGQVLAGAAETVVPVGSLNSEVGVPLTVCRVTSSTRFLVVEMGARGVGHIAYLTQIAPPRIGAVLNVGVAHVGEFGSREAIARAKAELVEALPADGIAVLNADDPIVLAMTSHTRADVVLVGESASAQVRVTDVVLDEAGRASFTLRANGQSAPVRLTLVGRHHVANALTVTAIALACGLHLSAIADALGAATPASRWRMEVTTRDDGVTVVNDAYNANPDSMRAALRTLHAMNVPARRVAVLGAMLELGDLAATEHAEIGAEAIRCGVEDLLVVGAGAEEIATGALAQIGSDAGLATTAPRVRRLPDADAAYAVLVEEVGPGDVVLFKSSRDAGLRWLGDRLAGRADPAPVDAAPVDPEPADSEPVDNHVEASVRKVTDR